MIICHAKKLIFIKTKKVGGTSFEIALSKHCGERCVITPITPADEALRKSLGYRGPQNYVNTEWTDDGARTRGAFFNHASAASVKAAIPPRIWGTYQKVTIVRNPYDVAISLYYWMGGERMGLTFLQFVMAYSGPLGENASIAPVSGEATLDCYLNYDRLPKDFEGAGLSWLWQDFAALRAKGHFRPPGATLEEIYRRFPEAVNVVRRACAEELDFHNFEPPAAV